MDKELQESAAGVFSELYQSLGATSFVCYFRNKFAGHYWLFQRGGTFRYPYQLHGGVSNPGHEKRITYGQETEELGIAYFPEIPEKLSENIRGGTSFIKREG